MSLLGRLITHLLDWLLKNWLGLARHAKDHLKLLKHHYAYTYISIYQTGCLLIFNFIIKTWESNWALVDKNPCHFIKQIMDLYNVGDSLQFFCSTITFRYTTLLSPIEFCPTLLFKSLCCGLSADTRARVRARGCMRRVLFSKLMHLLTYCLSYHFHWHWRPPAYLSFLMRTLIRNKNQ